MVEGWSKEFTMHLIGSYFGNSKQHQEVDDLLVFFWQQQLEHLGREPGGNRSPSRVCRSGAHDVRIAKRLLFTEFGNAKLASHTTFINYQMSSQAELKRDGKPRNVFGSVVSSPRLGLQFQSLFKMKIGFVMVLKVVASQTHASQKVRRLRPHLFLEMRVEARTLEMQACDEWGLQ